MFVAHEYIGHLVVCSHTSLCPHTLSRHESPQNGRRIRSRSHSDHHDHVGSLGTPMNPPPFNQSTPKHPTTWKSQGLGLITMTSMSFRPLWRLWRSQGLGLIMSTCSPFNHLQCLTVHFNHTFMFWVWFGYAIVSCRLSREQTDLLLYDHCHCGERRSLPSTMIGLVLVLSLKVLYRKCSKSESIDESEEDWL